MKRRAMRLLSLLALSAAALVDVSSVAWAQTYPSRPIRLIVGNPPGGATDIIARTIGQPLGARLGQNILVEHRPGANGAISAEVVANAAPDGHTILYANNSVLVINPHIYAKPAVNAMDHLVPVATTITNQLVLAVNPKVVPVDDFPSFVAFVRNAKSPLFYASIGNGSQHHLAMEMLKQTTGIELTHVPYKGGGPASISVIAGENAAMFGGASVVQHIKSGKLRGLAVSDQKGWATMPELPSIGEFYPGYRVALWHGILAPRATPQAIIDKLRVELNAVLALAQVGEVLVSSGAGEPYITTPEQFTDLMRADYERYGTVIKRIGLKVD